jgi:hypothetical protein
MAQKIICPLLNGREPRASDVKASATKSAVATDPHVAERPDCVVLTVSVAACMPPVVVEQACPVAFAQPAGVVMLVAVEVWNPA